MAGKRNFKQIIIKLVSRWYFYLIAVCITIPLAFVYLKITPKQYLIKASLLLSTANEAGKDHAAVDKTSSKKTSASSIEDEVGILKSNSTIENTIKALDFGVGYFTYRDFARSERYGNSPFIVMIDSMVNQVIEIPIYIERISSTRYRIRASGKSVKLYNFVTNQTEGTVDQLAIDEELPLDKPFSSKYLSFRIKFDDHYKPGDEKEMYFKLFRIQAITEQYQSKLHIDPISADSRIIDLSIGGQVVSKEKAFITKLLDTYLKSELDKKNQIALNTIQFVDNQLQTPSDTLSENTRNYLLQKKVEARIALASNAASTIVVDKPYAAAGGDPVYPKPETIYFLAILAGIIGAILFMFIKDLLNDNIVTSDDVEQNTKIPFIGTISHANKRDQGSIVAHARSSVGESFRSLRVNLQYLTLNANASVIGITSSRESEGKTFCSVNLAAVMAYSGRRTILIDTDMRRPRVATYFQLESRKGLSNFLVGDGTIKEIINNTEHKGFDVIGSGPIPPNPVDLIGNPRMEELINSLKQSYSTIILDSPPLGYVSEYIILMKYTDANLYIVRSDYTNRNSLKKINKLFEREKLNNFSILLNDVKPTKASGDYYTYGYGYGYKY
ncbi:MAG: polysaccharide biosynthesis tyrosine autokinase [Chryseolinea sp.]